MGNIVERERRTVQLLHTPAWIRWLRDPGPTRDSEARGGGNYL